MSRAFLILLFLCSSSLIFGAERIYTLEEAVRKGLENNRELVFREREAEIQMKKTGLEYRKFFPELSFGFGVSDNVQYGGTDSHSRQVNIGVSQLLYDRGVLAAGIKLGKEEAELNRLRLREEREIYIYSVTEAFRDVLERKKELEILSAAHGLILEQLETGKMERELGEMTGNDYLELEMAVSDMEIGMNRGVRKVRDAAEALRLIIGVDAEDIDVAGELNSGFEGFLGDVWEKAPASGTEYGTEIREKLFILNRAESEHRIMKRMNIPEISLACDFFMRGKSFKETEKGYSVTLSLDFAGSVLPGKINGGIGRSGGNLRSRELSGEGTLMGNGESFYSGESGKIKAERARYEYEECCSETESRIRQMQGEIKVLKENLRLMKRRSELEKRKLEIEKIRLELGEIKRTDYVESLVETIGSETEVIRCISELYSAEKNLALILGLETAAGSGKLLVKGGTL